VERTVRGKDRFVILELSADEGCGKTTLGFMEVVRTASPPAEDEEPASEASEWEKRERGEYLSQVEEEWALREGAEDLGA